MNAGLFSFHHPRAYRLVLTVGCWGMLACGIGSMALSHLSTPEGSGWVALSQLVQPASASTAPVVAVHPTATLPGTDGSVTPTQVQVDTAPAPAPAATVVSPAAATAVTDTLADGGDARALGRTLNAALFGDQYWEALDQLWTRESNWRPTALSGSGACGIPQALPCSKITDQSPQGQISWGLHYIQRRYGNPGNAWAHEERYGWY